MNWINRFRDFQSPESRVVSRVKKRLEKKENDRAHELVQDGLKSHPDSLSLKLMDAEIRFNRGAGVCTLKIVQEVVAASPQQPALLFAAARLLENLDQANAAVSVYDRLVDHSADDVAVYAFYLKARNLRRRNRLPEVIEVISAGLARKDLYIMTNMIMPLLRDTTDRDGWRQFLAMVESNDRISNGNCSSNLCLAVSLVYAKTDQFKKSISWIQKAKSARRNWWFVGRTAETADDKLLAPSFVVIGAMKCGTTSLFYNITQHRQVAEPIKKEIHYFQNRNAPLEWYMSHFPASPKNGSTITGEASPGYYALEVQDRIRQQFPKMKLICIMRDPVNRLFSHWHHVQGQDRVQQPIDELLKAIGPFRDVLRSSDERIENFLYDVKEGRRSANRKIAMGFYYYFLRRWYRMFPANQILLLSLSQLAAQPRKTMAEVFDFLEVSSTVRIRNTIINAGAQEPVAGKEHREIREALTALYADSNERLRAEFGIELGPL